MNELNLENIFKNNEIFVIAEIGHNHKGSLDIAKELFVAAKNSGVNAVKLQKRSNINLFTKKLYNQVYDNKNSYGATYGKHREYLEFDEKQYLELSILAKQLGLYFICTPFDFESVEFLKKIDISAFKIASADLNNLLLQQKIAEVNKPIFVSTGGGNYNDIEIIYKNITTVNNKVSLLHCTSSYPVEIKDMHLNVITELKNKYPKNLIGLSDHENGIDGASVAYMLGARVFEKHFTLNRSWKGTDHSFSLEPQGMEKLVRNLKRIPLMLGSKEKKLLPCEAEPLKKMSKSIVAKYNIKAGTLLDLNNLAFKSPGGGVAPNKYKLFLGKRIKNDVFEDDLITLEMIT
jgi:N-acetylneuraminate synthase/sialic acid synthase